jgi:hypothetical protein
MTRHYDDQCAEKYLHNMHYTYDTIFILSTILVIIRVIILGIIRGIILGSIHSIYTVLPANGFIYPCTSPVW